jgi:hypothetical protein
MKHSTRRINRFGLFSSFVGATAVGIALCIPAYADDGDEPPPIIVTGETVGTQPTFVDPYKPTTTPTPPIKPIGATEPRKPDCCVIWFPEANPPVVPVEQRFLDAGRYAYMDNHGRYWLLDRNTTPITFEQIGGWPQPKPLPPTP